MSALLTVAEVRAWRLIPASGHGTLRHAGSGWHVQRPQAPAAQHCTLRRPHEVLQMEMELLLLLLHTHLLGELQNTNVAITP